MVKPFIQSTKTKTKKNFMIITMNCNWR